MESSNEPGGFPTSSNLCHLWSLLQGFTVPKDKGLYSKNGQFSFEYIQVFCYPSDIFYLHPEMENQHCSCEHILQIMQTPEINRIGSKVDNTNIKYNKNRSNGHKLIDLVSRCIRLYIEKQQNKQKI